MKKIIIEKAFEGWPDQSEDARSRPGQKFSPSPEPVEVPDDFADDAVAKGLASLAADQVKTESGDAHD